MTATKPTIITIEHHDKDGTAFLVDVELAIVDGRVSCVAMTVRGYVRDPEEQDDHPGLGFPEPGVYDREVSSNVVRNLRPGELVAKAIKHLRFEDKWANLEQQRQPSSFDAWLAALQLEQMAEGTDQVSQRRHDILRRQYELENEFLATNQAETQWIHDSNPRTPKGGRPRIPDETLLETTMVYNAAVLQADRAPSKAVSRHFRIKPERGRRWVMYARQRGFPVLDPKNKNT